VERKFLEKNFWPVFQKKSGGVSSGGCGVKGDGDESREKKKQAHALHSESGGDIIGTAGGYR